MDMSSFTIDLGCSFLDENSVVYKERLVENYGSDVANPVINDLESENLFDWIDLFCENKETILETDNVIGTKDLELEELLDEDEAIRILIDSDKTSYDSVVRFSSILYTGLANQIDKRFDSSEKYANYLLEEECINKDEKEEFLDEISSDNYGIQFIESDLDSKVARLYDKTGFYFEMSLVGWDTDEIGSYDYLVQTVEKEGYDKDGQIAFKIENTVTDNVMLSDILDGIEEDSAEDEIIDSYIGNIECYVIAYESIVTDMYKNHKYATKDENELCEIDFTEEDKIDFYHKNPLPL